jgi:hypothetical protein
LDAAISTLDGGREAPGSGTDVELPACKVGGRDRNSAASVVQLAEGFKEAGAGPAEVRGGSREQRLERENEQLKQALAKKVVEADFLQGVLRRIEARRQPSSGSGETASTSRSK